MKKVLSLVALILSFIMLLPAVASTAAELASAEEQARLDFTASESYRKAYVSPSDLLSFLATSPHGEELAYIDGYFEEYLVYSAYIPDSYVSAERGIGSAVKVSAKEYSYIAKNGKKVTFTPVRVEYSGGSTELSKSGDSYTATVDTAAFRVIYNGSLPLEASVVKDILSFAYTEAKNASALGAFLSEYNKAVAEYRSYLSALAKYERDLELYAEYLNAKTVYDEALAAYNQSLEEERTYPQRLEAYEKYKQDCLAYDSKMVQYKQDYSVYEQENAVYKSYIENLSRIQASMAAINSIYTQPTNNTPPLFETLINQELFGMFLRYEELLVSSMGVKQEDMDYLRIYSDKLSNMLSEYFGEYLGSEARAFTYYKAHYTEFRDLFNGLYKRMCNILNPTRFVLIMSYLEVEYPNDAERKKWRVRNSLCHIYLICLTLDDKKTAESTWEFYGNDGILKTYYFSDLLSQNVVITDTNRSDPSELSWQQELVKPKAPEVPQRPEAVAEPLKPIVLPNPGKAPNKVEEPQEPTEVEAPNEPEGIDTELLFRTANIRKLLEDGVLTQRAEAADTAYPVSIEVNKSLSDKKHTVYAHSGEILGHIDSTEELSAFACESYASSRSQYTFVGWSLSPDSYKPLSEGEAENGAAIYQFYTESQRRYNITFKVDGKTIEKQVVVGQIPSVEDIPTEKASDAYYHYSFFSFDTPLSRANADKTYVAQYEHTERLYKITFNMGNKTEIMNLPMDSVIQAYPTPAESYFSGTSLFELIGWDKPLSAVSEDTIYTALYKESKMADLGESEGSIEERGSEYILTSKGAAADITALLILAEQESKGICLRLLDKAAELSVSLADVKALNELWAQGVYCTYDAEKGIGYGFTDDSGNKISYVGGLRLRIKHGYADTERVVVRAYNPQGYFKEGAPSVTLGGVTEISPDPDMTYRVVRKFSVTATSSESGSFYIDGELYREGDTVYLNILPDGGYFCSSLKLKNLESGEIFDLGVQGSFTVPPYNCELVAEFSPVLYTVTFSYFGKTEKQELPLGEMPVIPEIETSFTDNGLFHTFIGWSEPVGIVTGDITYTAKYFSIVEAQKAPDEGSAVDALVKNYVVPAVAIIAVSLAAVVSAAVIIPLVVIKKRKKRALNEHE